MFIFRETTTVKLFNEIRKQSNITHYQEERNLRGRKLKSAKKMYDGNTSKFDPIPENREHLVKTLMPMVLSIAKKRAQVYYSAKIEFDDCISAGLYGAIIATDRYIENSKIEVQPAKLSTYAFTYIEKYINEYIYNNTTSLSHGITKGREALQFAVLSGNKKQEDSESGTNEFFETSGDASLMSNDELLADMKTIDTVSNQIFSCITKEEKISIFMFFGVSVSRKYELKEIAKYLSVKQFAVEQMIQSAFEKIRTQFQNVDKSELLEIMLSGDLTSSKHWQKPIL